MLAPLGVLWQMNVHSSRKPCRCHVVGVVDEQVGRTDTAVIGRNHAQMDLDPVPRGEPVAAASVRSDSETELTVVRHRYVEVMDGEDRRYTLQAAHEDSLAWRCLRRVL